MKLTNLTGYFDCRIYKKDVARASRQMQDKEGRINFTVSMSESDLNEEVKEFANFSDKTEKYYLTFKIFPKICKLYTAKATQINFPDFGVIDGGRFDVNIEFSIKHGTGTELNGCYANAIQIIRRADVPFEAVDEGDEGDENVFSENVLKEDISTTHTQSKKTDDLPF